ncbi:MFS transporter [Legionella bononiensis]|uniref:MFS transporter n=1 Tax=Legionella bononiensis TaxID=2793102 RepID=A0ABS1WE12_9GAMM|nr:MFS transporter [Legionella bononiensis]MBL7479528.1 MFS transporter [Legionella bononiensis]MBL7527598.1 MFS transporter [Legionella bononiensis]
MNQIKSWHHASQTLTLLLIMFIDGVGMSLIIPLSGDLFSPGAYSLLSADAPNWINQFYYSANLAAFSIAMIFGASILGQLSDKYGRKLVLNLSLLGALAGYLLCAIAVISHAPSLFILGRIIDGLTAGSIPVAQAILTDIDSKSNQMTSIGRVMFAVTSGYMFGPVIAGSAYLGNTPSHTLPFLVIALSCIGCIGLLRLIKETKSPQSNLQKLKLFSSLTSVVNLFKLYALRSALLSFFLFQCAWTLFYQYLPKLQLGNSTALMAAIGAAMCFGFCFLVPKLKIAPVKLISGCFTLFAVLNFSFLVPDLSYDLFSVVAVCMALLYAVGYSAMLGFVLSISSDSEKGLILGSVASICAISAALTALLGGYLNALSNVAFFSVLLLMSLTALLMFFNASRTQTLKAA